MDDDDERDESLLLQLELLDDDDRLESSSSSLSAAFCVLAAWSLARKWRDSADSSSELKGVYSITGTGLRRRSVDTSERLMNHSVQEQEVQRCV